jgi:hypothetical protein
MTPFSAMQSLCGLSNREAADFLSVSEDTVKSWRLGRRDPAATVITELHNLWTVIDQAAVDHAESFANNGLLDLNCIIELGYPADDHEAHQLGMPCVGAWRQMAARLMDELLLGSADEDGIDPARIKFVARGSTPATAAAIEAHEKVKR